jgi:carboxypeptidase Q
MTRKHLLAVGLAATLTAAFTGLPLRAADETIDYDSINKIKQEGLNPARSKVMEISSYLTDVHGPRLTGSPNILKAGEWTVAQMKTWGLVNASLEPWTPCPPPAAQPAAPPAGQPAAGGGGRGGGRGGPPACQFPRGWSNDKFYMQAVAPQQFPIPGTPAGWSVGTTGLVRGDVVMVTETTEAELKEKYAGGKLKGKWVISQPAPDVAAYWSAPATRRTREELERMASPDHPTEFGVTPPGAARGGQQAAPAGRQGTPPAAATPPAAGQPPSAAGQQAAGQRAGAPPAAAAGAPAQPPAGGGGGGRGGGGGGFNRNAWFKAEGVLGVLATQARGHGIYTIGGSAATDPNTGLPTVTIPAEQYGRIARILEKGIPVTIEADIKNTYHPNPPMFNVVGEIRGTDKADEVVMLGAHFDSWHASTGATDNAAGSAAMLEAMRILKVAGVPLRRTVRIGLWTGEEQGLHGSRDYVARHFGSAGGGGRGGAGGAGATQTPPSFTPEHAKFSGYFNIDNGTGAIRGVYLQGNQAIASIFRAWMEPFHSIGMTTLTLSNTGGTDHGSFDNVNVNLPGFQFIQDEVEYDTMTHHTNLDSYERLQPEDMRRNATIAAAFAFLAANRDGLLPRKPPTSPFVGGGRGRGGN